MRFLVKQKVFTWGDNFTIKDDAGIDRFRVRGQIFTFGNKLHIYDMAGRELIYIEQKLFRFLPEYTIYYLGKAMATVKKEFTFFKPKFNIYNRDVNYSILGNFLAMDFAILRDGKEIAYVSKRWLSWGDTYAVDVADGENEAFILALVIVIDQVIYDDNHNNS